MILYMHISPSGKKYIGITKQEPNQRWRNGKGYKRNEYFYRAIQKYGWDNFEHKILYEGLSEDEANQLEEELVAKYETTNPQKGYNLHSGGLHHEVTEETREKLSKSKKGMLLGEENPFFGKHHTEEVLAVIRKRVEQYDCDGNLVAVYKSMKEACEKTGVDKSLLTKVCKGKRKTAGGYQWKYEDDERDMKAYRRVAHNRRRVRQLDMSDKEIKVFNSLTEAGRAFGINADKTIGDVCRGEGKTAYGFKWKFS